MFYCTAKRIFGVVFVRTMMLGCVRFWKKRPFGMRDLKCRNSIVEDGQICRCVLRDRGTVEKVP